MFLSLLAEMCFLIYKMWILSYVWYLQLSHDFSLIEVHGRGACPQMKSSLTLYPGGMVPGGSSLAARLLPSIT